MPDGSSSDAPVMRPGPRIFTKRLSGFGSISMAASSVAVAAAGSECGIRCGRPAPDLRRRVEIGNEPRLVELVGADAEDDLVSQQSADLLVRQGHLAAAGTVD